MAEETYREVNKLDRALLSTALAEAIAQEPDSEIITVAQEISSIFAGRNAEFVAIGFAAAYQYFVRLKDTAG